MKVSPWIVPILIIVLTLAGLIAAKHFAIPSAEVEFSKAPAGSHIQATIMVVDGVRCVDTALTAIKTLKNTPGIIKVTAYASHNRLEILFNPEYTNTDQIKEAIEGPIFDATAGEFLFNQYKVLKINEDGNQSF